MKRRSVGYHYAYIILLVFITGCNTITGSSGQGTVGTAFWSGQKCQAVADWLAQYQKEFPDEAIAYTPYPYNRALPIANLFRDDVFIPVFGFPYDRDHAEDLKKLNRTVIRACWHGRKRWESSDQYEFFGPLKPFFDQVFERLEQRLLAAARDMTEREEWRNNTLTALETLSFDETGFNRLTNEIIPRSRDKIAPLWPRDIRDFQIASLAKQKAIARHILNTQFADIESLPPTFETAHILKKAEPYIQALGSESYSRFTGIARKREEIIRLEVAEYVQRLKKIPLTVEGRDQSVTWLRVFEQKFKPHNDKQAVMNASRAWRQQREEIFQATREDFLKKLDALPTGPEAKHDHAVLLQQTFPLERDVSLITYKEYRRETLKRQKPLLERAVRGGFEKIDKAAEVFSEALHDIIHGTDDRSKGK